jgi:hypothetical protein
MNAHSFAAEIKRSPRVGALSPRLAGAELLKLRKRRGLVAASLALTVGPVLVAYSVLVLLHGSDPGEHGPAGGVENFGHSIQLLARLGVVAAFLVGVIAGAGDHRSGVFRELVVTGRSRLALFAARIPGGLAFLAPLFVAAFAIAAAASVTLAGSLETPTASVFVRAGAWLALGMAASFALALGVASLFRSATISIAVLLGWNFAVVPALQVIDALGAIRDWLLPVALERLQPADLVAQGTADSSLTVAVLAIAGWSLVPLAFGAWRTATVDA